MLFWAARSSCCSRSNDVNKECRLLECGWKEMLVALSMPGPHYVLDHALKCRVENYSPLYGWFVEKPLHSVPCTPMRLIVCVPYLTLCEAHVLGFEHPRNTSCTTMGLNELSKSAQHPKHGCFCKKERHPNPHLPMLLNIRALVLTVLLPNMSGCERKIYTLCVQGRFEEASHTIPCSIARCIGMIQMYLLFMALMLSNVCADLLTA